jgi:hypothetical protein
MRTGRPKQPLILESGDKEKLELLARRPKTAQGSALRAKIVLRAAEGLSSQDIARRLGVTLGWSPGLRQTVKTLLAVG